MADVFSKAKRSDVMARIRGKGNKSTEGALAAILRADGITGWRRHLDLPGKPDFAFTKLRLAVFVDGCFWHRCPRCFTSPATNAEFWEAKLAANLARDRKVRRQLSAKGWRVLRIWEHDLRLAGRVSRRIATALSRAESDQGAQRRSSLQKLKDRHDRIPI
ncbi:MAG: very short patch repair endonuclease [Acidobacteria bacterium]|nr:very short patch repair endonuclease [Acidobacteriota bacterium]